MSRQLPDDLTMLASFYSRWEPQEDTRRQISDDLKELFAEGKGNGLNAKAMRKAFAERYRLDHEDGDQRQKREATDEETEIYLSALARVRESGDENDGLAGPANGGDARTANTKPAPNSAAADQPESSATDAAASGTISTAARKDVQQPTAGYELGVGSASGNPRSAREGLGQYIPEAGTQAPPVDTQSPTDKSTTEAGAEVVAPSKLKWNPEYFDPPHPLCKRPKLCGGNSNIVVCQDCRSASVANDDFRHEPVIGSVS